MIELEGEIKKWGNSAGVRMKKTVLEENNVHLNEKVDVIIIPRSALKVKDLLGKLKSRRSTKEIMREIDRELDIEW